MRSENENLIFIVTIYLIFILPFIYITLVLGNFFIETNFIRVLFLLVIGLCSFILAFINSNEQVRDGYIMKSKEYGLIKLNELFGIVIYSSLSR